MRDVGFLCFLLDLFEGLEEHEVPLMLLYAWGDVAVTSWSCEIEREGLGALSFARHLDLAVHPYLQTVCLCECCELWVEIQMQGVIGHLDDDFLHQLKLSGGFDINLRLLRLRALPILVVHGDHVEVLERQ